jgi:hypothetical protein
MQRDTYDRILATCKARSSGGTGRGTWCIIMKKRVGGNMGKGAQQEERQGKKQDKTEHCLQCGIPVLALGRQRLALLGVLPSGAGPKAQMSRASVPFLSLK